MMQNIENNKQKIKQFEKKQQEIINQNQNMNKNGQLGVLLINIISASDLEPIKGKETVDSFVKMQYGNQNLTTKVIKNSNNPEWNEQLAM